MFNYVVWPDETYVLQDDFNWDADEYEHSGVSDDYTIVSVPDYIAEYEDSEAFHDFIHNAVNNTYKPCPFCGSTHPNTYWDIDEAHSEGFNIECCHISIHTIKKDEAIELWNERK